MRILAIETSCDETALALLECSGNVESPIIQPISQALYSQVKEHAPFGGVFPALAKREHIKNIVPLFLECLEKGAMLKKGSNQLDEEKIATIRKMLEHEGVLANFFIEHIVPLERPAIDAIAVTRGPGLEPALWVGVNFAKALSYLWDMPIVPTNHMEGHIASVLVNEGAAEIRYPALALLASGGHTELVLIDKPLSYRRIGQTRDDAVGEAFDKVARLLGLPYPGGPQISKLAAQVRERISNKSASNPHEPNIKFPRPMVNSDDYDFSYAGLKTAVLYKIQELGELTDELRERIAYEFEEAATDVLISKTKKALATAFGGVPPEAGKASMPQVLIVGGGVIANMYLRERLVNLAAEAGVILMLPARELSTDNAIMIGAAAYLHLTAGETYESYSPTGKMLEANGTLRL